MPEIHLTDVTASAVQELRSIREPTVNRDRINWWLRGGDGEITEARLVYHDRRLLGAVGLTAIAPRNGTAVVCHYADVTAADDGRLAPLLGGYVDAVFELFPLRKCYLELAESLGRHESWATTFEHEMTLASYELHRGRLVDLMIWSRWNPAPVGLR